MIISGFTQRKSSTGQTDDVIIPGQHSHCVRCHLVSCSKFVDNVTACVMVTCESCGWRCHTCKLLEHTLTCPEERVACLNKEYGCPHLLKRSRMAAHLIVCPASVVFCAEEWSRWPMHAREHGVRMPLPQEKSYVDCGQLDVGLAMRDQRMLIDSLRAPRKLRHILRNSLTQKYPAAPLPQWRTSFDSDPVFSGDTSQTVSEDDADTPWDLSKTQPGLTESIRSRLFRVTKETADSLAAALELTSNVLSSSQNRLLEISEAGDGSALELKSEAETSDMDTLQPKSLLRPLSSEKSDELTENSFISPVQEFSPEPAINTTAEVNSNRADTEGNLNQSSISDATNPFVDRLTRSSISSDRCSNMSTRSKSTLHDIGGTQLHKLIGYQPEEGQEDEVYLHKMLGVSINTECINKYVTKPASMYTFICAQSFRRDEYRWHFKNVHLEIHTGFCGWLEQRCPLANLGCTFSFQRMEPAQPNTVVYHSWLQESFGLRSTVQPVRVQCDSNAASSSKHTFGSSVNPLTQFSPEMELNQIIPGNIAQLKDQYHNERCGIIDSAVDANLNVNDLIKLDKDFDSQSSAPLEAHTSAKTCSNCTLNTVDKFISLDSQQFDKPQDGTDQSLSNSQEQDDKNKTVNFMRVQPTIYTASNWDSKVLFQYDLEAEGDDELTGTTDVYLSLTNLPFEVLSHIARHLDSFSLCNLSLTCRLLRDVCCSLLDDHGIVLLNWQKQRSEISGKVSWKVANKRWMFSTSFEPIHSWRFTNNHPTIGDHMKVCPFNKDVVRHTAPLKLLLDGLKLNGQSSF